MIYGNAETAKILKKTDNDDPLLTEWERDLRAVAARAMVAEKAEKAGEPADDKPKGATCPECNGKIAILDGCATCLDCGASKCG